MPSEKKARIAVVIPPTRLHMNRDIGFKELLPHIGVAYVAAAFRSAGAEVMVIDAVADRMTIESVITQIENFSPDAAGFTASTYQINESTAVAEQLVGRGYKGRVLIGGYHVSALPVETLEQYACFDTAVFGEGEGTAVEIVNRIEAGQDFSGLKGTALKSGGGVVLNAPRELLSDLDELPFPAFDLMPTHRYRGFYSMHSAKVRPLTCCTARGCPFKCIFCFKSTGSVFRKRSVASVMEELRISIEELNATQIVFTDEIFTFDKQRTKELCESIIAAGYHKRINWICQDRVDLAEPETLKLMKKAGCNVVSYGVEAGNQSIVSSIGKNFKLEKAAEAIRWTKEAGIWADTNFIIGHPGEDREKIMQTIEFAISIDPDTTSFAILCPFPGTEVARMAKAGEGGLRLLSEDWTTYGKQLGEALELENMPRSELSRYHRLAYRRFYLRRRKWLGLFRVVNMKALPIYLLHTIAVSFKHRFKSN